MRAPLPPALARAIVTAVIAVVAAAAVPGFAQTKPNFPVKPVRVVTGAYGSPSDILARTLGPKLSERWGQPVVVENRAGAAGMIGANIVAKAPADGYTLLLLSAQFAILAVLQSNLPYDSLKDFAGVTQLGFRNVPAMSEVLPGFGRDGSHSLLAPAGTPLPILIQISKDVARTFELPDAKERLQSMGFHLAPTTPEEQDQIVRAGFCEGSFPGPASSGGMNLILLRRLPR